MSVQSQIDRINENVANTYSALNEMGATMPEQQNSNNMAATVLTVPRGGTSVQSDWNQTDETAADFIKNKPFGEMETGLDTLVWNASNFSENTPIVLDAFFLASDKVFNVNDLADEGYTMTLSFGGQSSTDTVSKSEILNNEDNIFLDDGFCLVDSIMIIPFDNYDLSALVGDSFIIPQKGIYMGVMLAYYDFTIQFHGITVFSGTKKINDAYIPAITYDKLPKKIILYHDNEGYLYADDTADTSKRMTRAELLRLFETGFVLWSCLTPSGRGYVHTEYAAISQIQAPRYGYASVYTFATINNVGGYRWLYTAEYEG